MGTLNHKKWTEKKLALHLKNRQTDDKGLLQRKLLLPLTCVLLLLVGGFSITLLISHQRSSKEFNQYQWNNIIRSQNILLARKARMITTLIDAFTQEKNLGQALQNKNRVQLLADFGPFFRSLQKQKLISHFHFYDSDRINLLRLDKPDKSGDRVDRFTLREAERTGEVAWGIELVETGVFSLSVVRPFYLKSRLVGYIELGQEIEGLLNSMCQWFRIELAITIRKENIERNSWEAGMRTLDRAHDWNRFEQDLLVYSTLAEFPSKFDLFIHGNKRHRSGQVSKGIEFDNRLWEVFILPVKDASGHEKGDQYILYDVTDKKRSFLRLVINTFGIALFLMISVVCFYSVVLKRTDRVIQRQYEALSSKEKKLNKAQQVAQVGSWEFDFATNTFSFSDEFARILGLPPQQAEINYASILNYVHPDDRMLVKSAYIKSVKNKKSFNIIHRLLLQDGTQKNVNTHCETSYRATGEAIRSFGTIQDITQINRIKKALKEGESKCRHLIETTSEGLWVVDSKFRTVTVNESLCRMLGYTKDEMLGKTPDDFLDHENRKRYTEQKLKMSSTVHRNYEGNLRRSNGEVIPVMVRATTMRNAEGDIQGAFAFISDLTERKQKENTLKRIKGELEKSHSLLHEIINNSSAVIYVKDHNGKYVLINNQYKKVFNTSDRHIIGKTVFDIFPKELAHEFHENDKAILQSNSAREFEEVVQHEDGDHVYLSLKFPLFAPGGSIYSIGSISTDITERKQLERKILEINERLTALVNASPDIICFKDGTGRWLLANEAALQLFQLSGVNYKGKTDAELAGYSTFYREALLSCIESDEQTWKKGVLFSGEELIPVPNGEDKIFQVVKVPLFHPDGTRNGLVALGHDVTNHLKVEKRLRQEIDAHLETSELIEQKRKEAEDANIALRVLLNQQKNAAEEIQQHIIAQLEKAAFPYIELLAQCLMDDKGKDYLDILSSHLRIIGSSFIKKLSDPDLGLTKREILVADLVRQGKSTKEIARLLSLQARSVESYRNRIRKKLHLNSKKVRLEQYLKSTFCS